MNVRPRKGCSSFRCTMLALSEGGPSLHTLPPALAQDDSLRHAPTVQTLPRVVTMVKHLPEIVKHVFEMLNHVLSFEHRRRHLNCTFVQSAPALQLLEERFAAH